MSTPTKKGVGLKASQLIRRRIAKSPTPSVSSLFGPEPGYTSDDSTTTINSTREKAISCSGDGLSVRSQSQGLEARHPRTFAHPAFADIGNMLKKCNDTLSDIHMLGVSHVATLPELILVGDQSSGKSSLMSALARLDLPTSNGICTRCPFHIRMSSSKDPHWSCTVSLQQEYEYHPRANRTITQADVTKRNPFPPWEPKLATETIVFKTIHENDPISIDEMLRWAQVATLNPSRNPEQFVPGEGNYAKQTSLETAKRSTESRFSPNVVILEVKGPGFPDLSFYDLPGIFQTAEDKSDDYLVNVVENLTRKYIVREGAIIMLALPMDQDLDNSKTLGVIRDLNAEGRTIGVLTKADRPNFEVKDKIDYWLAVLQEKKQQVKQEGFYVTSLPPNQPLDNLEEWEKSFFDPDVGKWPRDFRNYTARFGVDKLRCHVTKALSDAFIASLPDIKEKFEARLRQIQNDLIQLPDIPLNVKTQVEVQMSLKDFYASVKHAVDNQDFEQNCKALADGFFECLVRLKPKCVMITEKPNPPRQQIEEVVIVSEDSGCETTGSKRSSPWGSPVGRTPKRKRRTDLLTSPLKEEYPADTDLLVTPMSPEHQEQPGTSTFQLPQTDAVVKLSLLEINNQIKLNTRGGFGDVIPFQVLETLCLKAVSQWDTPLEIYVDKATTMLTEAVTKALQRSLRRFSKRLIYTESYEHLVHFLKVEGARQRERLRELYNNETYKVVTVNEGGLNHFKSKEKELLQNHRLFTRAKAAGLIEKDRQFKRDEQMSREEKLEQSKLLDKYRPQFKEDEFEREIDVAAKVRAYYMTAATRFVDGVSMDINSRLFRSLRDGALDHSLDAKLKLSPEPTSSTYEWLMEEDTATARRRQQLRKEQEKLEIAMNGISEVERSRKGYTLHGQRDLRRSTACASHGFS